LAAAGGITTSPLAQLLRPRQAYKNLIVLAPLLFSGHALDAALWPRALLALAGFVALSGAVYAVNDVVDAGRDRLHPIKRHRPVARGALPPAAATAAGCLLGAVGMLLLFPLGRTTGLLGAGYVALQVAYTLFLKHVLIWDTLAIGLGFVLRALAGTTAIAVGPPTVWLIVCTFLFALHLALAKRRRELLVLDRAGEHRPTLGLYTVPFVEQLMQATAAILLVAYALYTFTGTDPAMMVTLPFAFYGIFRFDWRIQQGRGGDETDVVLRDPPLLWNGLAWILVVLAVQADLPQRLLAAVEGG
jgi:4-hydroxybenzoate polyprenyltransferase